MASEAPNGGWGWAVVVAATFCQMLICSCFVSYSVIYVELAEALNQNNAILSLIGSIQTGICFFFSVISGALVHHYGSRRVSVVGFFVAGLGLVASSWSNDVTTLCLTYGVLGGIGLSLTVSPTTVIVHHYFSRKRALASGLSSCGFSLGGMLAPLIVRQALKTYGWRGTLLLHGGAMFQGILFSAAYRPVHHSQEKPVQDTAPTANGGAPCTTHQAAKENTTITGSTESTHAKTRCTRYKTTIAAVIRIFDFKLLKNCDFLLYSIGNFLLFYASMTFYQHVGNMGVYKGLSKDNASLLVSVIGGTNLVSRLSFSFISNMSCVNRTLQYCVGTIVSGTIIIVTFLCQDFASLLAVCVMFGICRGSLGTIQSTVLVDLVGVDRVALATGLVAVFLGFSTLIASPISGMIVDIFGNYDIAFAINGSVQIVGGICIFWIYIMHKCDSKTVREENGQCQAGSEMEMSTVKRSSITI